jgi:hypothetical protein
MPHLPSNAHIVMRDLKAAILRLYGQQQAMHRHHGGMGDWWDCPCPNCACMRTEVDEATAGDLRPA